MCVSLFRVFKEWLDLRTVLDLFLHQFDGLLGDFSHVELHLTEKSVLQHLPWEAAQPVRICHSDREDVVPPGEQSHVSVRLIRKLPKMLVSPIPFDNDRNLFMLLLQRVEVARAPYSELLCEVEEEYLLPSGAWSTHCLVVPLSMPSSMLLQIELQSPMMPG